MTATDNAAARNVRRAISADEQEYDRTEHIMDLEQQMLEAAQQLAFEKAASLRDQIKALQEGLGTTGSGSIGVQPPQPGTPGVRPSKTKRKKKMPSKW